MSDDHRMTAWEAKQKSHSKYEETVSKHVEAMLARIENIALNYSEFEYHCKWNWDSSRSIMESICQEFRNLGYHAEVYERVLKNKYSHPHFYISWFKAEEPEKVQIEEEPEPEVVQEIIHDTRPPALEPLCTPPEPKKKSFFKKIEDFIS